MTDQRAQPLREVNGPRDAAWTKALYDAAPAASPTDVEVAREESWDQRDRRLRANAILLSDSPPQTPCSDGAVQAGSMLQHKRSALGVAYQAGALSFQMYQEALVQLEQTFALHDGVILEQNCNSLDEHVTCSSADEDDDRDGWFLVLESNEENGTACHLCDR